MKRIIFIGFLLVQNVWAQSYLEVYRKIGEVYTNARSFRVEVNVAITYRAGYEVGNQSYSGLIQKKDKQMYTRFADKINICNEGKNVFIDAGSRIIMISRSEFSEQLIRKNILSGFEEKSYLKKYDFKFLRNSEDLIFFEILPRETNSVYKRIELGVNSTDFSLKNVIYEMNEIDGNVVEKIEITYPRSEFNMELEESDFLLKNYITHYQQSYKGIGNYANFKVINQIK
jgi:hypothetical protein